MCINPDEFDTVYKYDVGTFPFVIVTHKPSGLSATCFDTCCELLNKSKAIACIARQLEGNVYIEDPRVRRMLGRTQLQRYGL